MFEFIVLVILIFYVVSLSNRVSDLERKLGSSKESQNRPEEQPKVEAKSTVSTGSFKDQAFAALEGAAAPQVSEQQSSPMQAREQSGPSLDERFYAWVKEDFFVKLGALLLIIAFGWFASYAFANNWINEFGRIILGILAGIAFIGLAEWRIKNFAHQGGIFMILGSTIVLLTMFAARELYDMFTPFIALISIFFAALYVSVASVRYKMRSLSFAGLVMAMIAPLFVASPEPSIFGLFSYLLIVVIATLSIVYVTGWKVLAPTALAIVSLYSVPYLFEHELSEAVMLLMFSFVFTLIFFIVNTISMIKEPDKISNAHLATGFITGLYLISWILAAASEEIEHVLLLGWTFIFALGAYLMYKRVERREPMYMYAATSLVLLVAATAALFDGGVLTFAYTIEVALLVLGSYALTKRYEAAEKASLLFVGPIILSFGSVIDYDRDLGFMQESFVVLAVLTLVLLSFGLFFRREGWLQKTESFDGLVVTYFGLGLAYLYGILALQYEGTLLVSLYTILTAAIVIGTNTLARKEETVEFVSFLFLMPVALSLPHVFGSAWDTSIPQSEFFMMVTMLVVFFIFGDFFRRNESAIHQSLAKIYTLGGAVYALILVWQSLHASFSSDTATTLSLIIYTVVGLALYIPGRMKDNTFMQYGGGALIGFVVAHLLLIDVWDMELTGRIITFFVIGLLLIATAFIGRKKEYGE